MGSATVFTCVVILGITLGGGVHGYGNGAAHPACTHMHVAHGEYQRGPSPYSITLPDNPTKYSAGCKVKRKCLHSLMSYISKSSASPVVVHTVNVFLLSNKADKNKYQQWWILGRVARVNSVTLWMCWRPR